MEGEPFILFKRPGDATIQLGRFQDGAPTQFHVASFDGDHQTYFVNLSEFDLTNLDGLLRDVSTTAFQNELHESAAYQNMVIKAVDLIHRGNLEKVVLARQAFYREAIHVPTLMQRLFEVNDAFVYLSYLPKWGLWFGASPEQLLRVHQCVASAMALAGTRLSQGDSQWTEKEYREQETVDGYLKQVFEQHGLQSVSSSGVQDRFAGKIKHLCSEVRGELDHPGWTQELIDDLHPTPALGGSPKSQALQFIKENEGFSRQLYGGYLGFETGDELELFVNIRCARVYNNGILQFAGAGINSGSVPESEWKETENKLEVLSQLF